MCHVTLSQEAELRLLMGGGGEGEPELSSEDEREELGLGVAKKKQKLKLKQKLRQKGSEVEEDAVAAAGSKRARFELDAGDARFAAVFSDPRFHIDPSSHEFTARDTPGTWLTRLRTVRL